MVAQVKVIEDSIAPHGVRLTTYQLRYWRAIHAEVMTHRVFSRNASSSRAIPVAKMLEQVRKDPAMPIHWGKNQPGMQAREECDEPTRTFVKEEWLLAAKTAASHAEKMSAAGVHKQVVNRILEPFQYISVICTATEYDNFFELRCHPDAQPEIQELAELMRDARERSTPELRPRLRDLAVGWHLPYITYGERTQYATSPRLLAKVSAARCARVSFLTHDGRDPNLQDDLDLYDRLVGSRPLHASPVEHQAYPNPLADQWCKNFRGWRQHRDIVEFETT